MVGSIIVFLLVLSILVLVHELGHFIVAKKNGIWVEEFGFGLPPRVFGKKIGETIYSLNLFPFGGFVRLHGEMNDEGVSDPKRAFVNKKLGARAAVVVAGVVMNIVLALLSFSIVYSFSGIPKETRDVKIVDISGTSPLIGTKLVIGDTIKRVNGKDVYTVDEFVTQVDSQKGKKITLETANDKKVSVTPRENPPSGEGPLGVVITTTEIYFPPIYLRPFYGIYYGTREALFWGETVLNGFFIIFSNLAHGVVPKDVSGPIGIYAITSEAAKLGIISLVNFVGILSINLAILNIFPFPALDGGRLLFIVIEALTKKKVSPRVETIIHNIGFIILLLLIIVITFNDIKTLISAGGISGFISKMVK